MIRSSHVLRSEYEQLYRALRKGENSDSLYFEVWVDRKLLNAAKESCGNRNDEFVGWTDTAQMVYFFTALAHSYPELVFPF